MVDDELATPPELYVEVSDPLTKVHSPEIRALRDFNDRNGSFSPFLHPVNVVDTPKTISIESTNDIFFLVILNVLVG